MDNINVNDLRIKFPKFIYKKYEIFEEKDKIIIKYIFEIPTLTIFEHKIEILKKDFKFKNIETNLVKNMVFNLGMVEAISYFKVTCSPEFMIDCGRLDKFQEAWFKKLYYLGLGEFRYVNNISIKQEDFVQFISNGEALKCDGTNYTSENKKENNIQINFEIENTPNGIIIPIGGGKDSDVTLDLLKDFKKDTLLFRIGMNDVALQSAIIAGFSRDNMIEVNRKIDSNLLELNKKGFLNGHTPFSAMVAFLTYLVSYLLNKKYIALSNEDSANENNVVGENINHQYSKTLEFENDFRTYVKKYLSTEIEYFSILRPISELQIAMLFSRLDKFHGAFKSCNVGSKEKKWIWCCNCPKCLFVFIMLSPFLYKDKLISIFGEDLFEKESLLETFINLCGYGKIKPFECVGTYKEIRYALTKTISNLDKEHLPLLLKYYNENFEKSNEELLNYYNTDNNVPEIFEKILKEKLHLC